MNRLFNEENHITPEACVAFRNGSLSETELLSIADHIAACDSCAQAVADCFDPAKLVKVPGGFLESIECSVHQNKKSETSLWMYAFRVGIAACAAIVISLSGILNSFSQIPVSQTAIKAPDFAFVDTVSSDLNRFSQRVIKLEVFHHAKEKK